MEGHAEHESVPALIRRVLQDSGVFQVTVTPGIRIPRSRLVKQGELERVIRYARKRAGVRAIALLADADEDCPRDVALELLARGMPEIGECRLSVVLAKIELEAWFIGGIESLRGVRGIRDDATAPQEPEVIRDAKGWLTRHMLVGRSYVPVDDQTALAMQFNYGLAAQRCRSLRKFLKDIGAIGFAIDTDQALTP